MFELSNRDIAFLALGFFGGIILVIFILKILGFGSGRGGRGSRRRRAYRDDDDDYDRGSRSSYFWVIILLIVGAVFGYNRLHSVTLAKAQKNVEMGSQTNNANPTPTTTAPIPEVNHEDDYIAEDLSSPTEDEVDETPINGQGANAQEETQYFIRIHVLSDPDNVEPCCIRYVNRGLPVVTKEKETGTAIYIGPYPSEELASWVNETQNLKGVLESF